MTDISLLTFLLLALYFLRSLKKGKYIPSSTPPKPADNAPIKKEKKPSLLLNPFQTPTIPKRIQNRKDEKEESSEGFSIRDPKSLRDIFLINEILKNPYQ